MEIIYRAKDGKEFTNEDDCYDYEHRCLYENPLPLFFDKNFNFMTSIQDIEETEDLQYILCRNRQEYDNMIALFDYLGIEAPDDEWVEGNGYCLLSWGLPKEHTDDWGYGWVNLTEQILVLQDICDKAADCLQDNYESEVK
jgi:hypothetical protein